MKKHAFVLGMTFSLLLMAATSTAEDDAFSKAKEALEKVKAPTLFQKVVAYGSAAVHGAEAVKNLIDLIKTFTGGGSESAELRYMKEQFAIVNTKLDALEYDFAEVKNLIDWRVVKVNVGRYEGKIRQLSEKLTNLVNAPSGATEVFKMIFVSAYEFEYTDSAFKLYNALSNENNIFSDNLFRVSAAYFENHKARIVSFIGYVLQTIQKGLMLEAAYHNLTDSTDRMTAKTKEWQHRFKALESIAKKADAEIEAKWATQFAIDADKFAVKNAGLSNVNMAGKLFNELSKKYPWRKWYVLVYTFTKNNPKDRYFNNCGHGFVKTNVGNKVVIVNSFSSAKTRPKINLKSVFSVFGPGPRSDWVFKIGAEIARLFFQKIKGYSCDHYLFLGVFENKSGPVLAGDKRFIHRFSLGAHRDFHSTKMYTALVIA